MKSAKSLLPKMSNMTDFLEIETIYIKNQLNLKQNAGFESTIVRFHKKPTLPNSNQLQYLRFIKLSNAESRSFLLKNRFYTKTRSTNRDLAHIC